MRDENTLKLLHYCVTNLDSQKIRECSPQIGNVGDVINRCEFDVLSLNGLQYDFLGVPDATFGTTGRNLETLLARWGVGLQTQTFAPSNIGASATAGHNGEYFRDPSEPGAMSHVDDVNFGTMPGQLSAGAATRYMLVEKKDFTTLRWKDFNPVVTLSRFRTPTGRAYPEQMCLFDKSFSDITLRVGQKDLHLILLHPTPSYHFGNPFSINEHRNAEQLRFLEWYVSGATDHEVRLPGITPLTADDYFIIVGDLNADINNHNCEGAAVLRRILDRFTPWMKVETTTFTNEAPHFGPDPLRLLLDYMIASTNIEVLNGGVLWPDFSRCELGTVVASGELPEGTSMVAYRGNETNLVGEARTTVREVDDLHYALVASDYVLFKQASHHYPIFGEFKLK